jgi:hypothetical protein
MPVPDDAILPDDSTVTLLATVETRRRQLAAMDNERGAEFCRWIVAGSCVIRRNYCDISGKVGRSWRREELEVTAQTLRRLRKDALAVEGSSAGEVRGTLLGLD